MINNIFTPYLFSILAVALILLGLIVFGLFRKVSYLQLQFENLLVMFDDLNVRFVKALPEVGKLKDELNCTENIAESHARSITKESAGDN